MRISIQRSRSSACLPRSASDNGPPFASGGGAGGPTQLSVWWIQLGIQVERITPGKPQE
jgi:hypothetical protein